MLCILSQYIVNVQRSASSEGLLTIFTFGIRLDVVVNSEIGNKYSHIANDLIQHIVGGALTSDWFVSSFTMGSMSIFLSSARIFCPKHDLNDFSQATITKLLKDQSEVSALPAG